MAKRPHERCGARNRHGGTCQHPAGYGTDHNGSGRCKFHGGASPGALPGNQNAVTHGLTRLPLLRLTGRAGQILGELRAAAEAESPRDPEALCVRLRDVELSLASELVELDERRNTLVTEEWNEDRYQVLRERIHKRLAQTQGILASLLARFPSLKPSDDGSRDAAHVLGFDDGEHVHHVVIHQGGSIEADRALFEAAGLDLSKRPE